MKVTENYFVIRSPEIKKYVCNAKYGTETKLLISAQRFDSLSEAYQALDDFKTTRRQSELNDRDQSIASGCTESFAEKEFNKSVKVFESYKVFGAERSYELHDEVPA